MKPKIAGKYVPILKFTTSGMINQPSQSRSTLTSLGKVPTRQPTQKDTSQFALSQSDQVLRDFNTENHQAQHIALQGTSSTASNVQLVLMPTAPDQATSDSLDVVASLDDCPSVKSGPPAHTFAEVLDFSKGFSPMYQSVEHKPDVKLIFLGFKRVAYEGSKILLIQVATAVGNVVGPKNVDAIQPMRNSWQIYVKTNIDRQKLLTTGLELAGKLIDLQAHVRDPNFSQNVKIILKDLPLNEVTNERVLMTLKLLEGIDV